MIEDLVAASDHLAAVRKALRAAGKAFSPHSYFVVGRAAAWTSRTGVVEAWRTLAIVLP